MMNETTKKRPSPEQVAQAFRTPRRPADPRALVLEGGECLRVPTPVGEIALQRAGTGPAVLLLHGWEGQASDLEAFAAPLLAAGSAVVAMHLPAHGDSGGQQSSIPEAARALCVVGSLLGPLQGVISHSVGCAVLGEALNAGLAVNRVVMISAPARYVRYATGVAAAAGLDAEGTEAMLAILSREMGTDVREVSLPKRAPKRHEPALFIHSTDDRVISVDDSLATAAAWPGARHQSVEGLGHRRILTDPAVVEVAVSFVCSAS